MPGAPVFNGTPYMLNRFFWDMDILYSTTGTMTTDWEKIQRAIHYQDCDTADLWELIVEHPYAPGMDPTSPLT
jgi:hypothetical protein